MDVVQAETSGLPSPDPSPSLQLPELPAQNLPPKTNVRDTETIPRSCGDISNHPEENITTDPTPSQDDEVQFVFSVPRRRRKKRKRFGSSCKSSSIIRESKTSASPLCSTSTIVSNTARRGSTGMVQQLDSCHTDERIHTPAKSGSLPTITQNLQSTLANHQPACISPPSMLVQSASSLSFSDGIPWWDLQVPPVRGNGSFQFDVCGMPFAEEILKKRKYEEDPQVASSCPSQRSQSTWASSQTTHSSGYSDRSLCAIVEEPSNGYTARSQTQTRSDVSPKPTFLSGSSSNHIRPRHPAPIPTNMNTINEKQRQIFQQKSPDLSFSVPSFHNDFRPRQTIQVPVSFVPELSVSPRTKTVQLFRPLDPDHALSRQSSLHSGATPRTAPLPPSFELSTASHCTPSVNLNHYSISSNVPNQTQNPLPPQQTNPNDILRKPSLYKIPPWPSPSIHHRQPRYMNNVQSSSPNIRSGTFPSSRGSTQPFVARNQPAIGDMAQSRRGLQMEAQAKSYSPTRVVSPSSAKLQEQQRSNNQDPSKDPLQITPATRQHSLHMNAQSYTRSVPLQPIQSIQSTRKYPPNLIVDIAETCQEHFPFAAVAERHKQPIQKVFDTFSAIIQLPLLRSAADNRRHGDLAKTRLKDFREAKKAMERAQEQERKKVLREAEKAESGNIAVQKMSKRAPGLLKAAVLNNARGKDGGTES